ncbi:hypothetical protein L6164_026521 [Bauhinia variegata]|uniref:Uncharacterized protein n=1 Tax=Bauhinia variegata TaxID=167791 RepID=A0ACB9LRB0_BAUVA|nr:hypothetical protein L6164_026521 [Bauhinia variegata]
MKNTQVAVYLALAFFFYGAHATTVTLTNKCQDTVWPATLANAGSPQLSTTGFELASQASKTIDFPAAWAGRFWARTQCSGGPGSFRCVTGNCGSGDVECKGLSGSTPATLMEVHVQNNGEPDFYDVSNVDGFNVPMSITPQGGTGDCQTSSCAKNINDVCLEDLKFVSDGKVVGCKSACEVYGGVQYCCKSDDTPQTCPPTKYSQFFEEQCPQAYSYAKDDVNSTFTCKSVANYVITFCP